MPANRTMLLKLAKKGLVAEDKLDECISEAQASGAAAEDVLVRKGYAGEPEVLSAIAEELGLEFHADLSKVSVPQEFLTKVRMSFARTHCLAALSVRNGTVTVATASPLDLHPLDDLASMLGCDIEPVVAPRAEIVGLINRAYEAEAAVGEMLQELEDDEIGSVEEDVTGPQELLDIANKAPIIKLVNMIISEALRMRASDVHIQPYEDRLQIRYRIDGILYDTMTPPKKYHDAVVSRIKVMGRMDIAERRMPQDGRSSVTIAGREVDIRISSIPTSWGERIVMRLLDKGQKLYLLESLGLYPEQLDLIKKLTSYSHGIIFVTGPTGSGKTTTLYAGLSRINSPEKNIITIEDPIEYQLKGISQMEVSGKKGMTFATGLRHIVRQDPDIIMVGEVRDLETARISIQSALTGHLVFSTMHTNDSAGAITRLLDLGIESYLISSSLVGVIAQRLIRVICPDCRVEYEPEEAIIRSLGIDPDEHKGKPFYRGEGCDSCMGRGYLGRSGIFEILGVDDKIRELIKNQATAGEIKNAAAAKASFSTLRMDGARKVLDGVSTAEEVLKVTQMDMF